MKNQVIFLLFIFFISISAFSQFEFRESSYQTDGQLTINADAVIPGAERFEEYIPFIKQKRVAVFANHTSTVGGINLVDVLLKQGIQVKVIFGPEHGFRGTADAGEKIGNYNDEKTGIPVVSLYGAKRKPSAEDLKDVDVMIFDIQDVGVRFYTYISSLQEYIESAIENNKLLIVLDRPNPNGFYVDGPVLNKKFRSFVGMQPIPIVYGMTVGEYASMLIGEKWIDSTLHSKLGPDAPLLRFKVIPCKGYTHNTKYILPVKPSPNLPDIQSIYWYPSTCFFEGTRLSEGRGTEKPFQVFGHPSLPANLYSFTPKSMPGAGSPKLKDQLCYGWNLGGSSEQVLKSVDNKIQLKWILEAYRLFPAKDSFFIIPRSGKTEDAFFNKLAGNSELMEQIKQGRSEAEIRKSWEPALSKFKTIRKKYLLYPDFN